MLTCLKKSLTVSQYETNLHCPDVIISVVLIKELEELREGVESELYVVRQGCVGVPLLEVLAGLGQSLPQGPRPHGLAHYLT